MLILDEPTRGIDVGAKYETYSVMALGMLVGCAKSMHSLIVGAASTGLPSIVVTGGSMLTGWFHEDG